MKYWLLPHDANAYVDLSSNDASSILAATDYWVTCSAVAVGFICIICALSWWHQRRLRKLFVDEADSLDTQVGRLSSCRAWALGTLTEGVDEDGIPPF